MALNEVTSNSRKESETFSKTRRGRKSTFRGRVFSSKAYKDYYDGLHKVLMSTPEIPRATMSYQEAEESIASHSGQGSPVDAADSSDLPEGGQNSINDPVAISQEETTPTPATAVEGELTTLIPKRKHKGA